MLLAGFTWSTGHPEAVWLLAGVWLLLLVGGCLLLAAAVSTKAAMEVLEAAAPSGRSVCATGQPAAAAFSISSALGIRVYLCRNVVVVVPSVPPRRAQQHSASFGYESRDGEL